MLPGAGGWPGKIGLAAAEIRGDALSHCTHVCFLFRNQWWSARTIFLDKQGGKARNAELDASTHTHGFYINN